MEENLTCSRIYQRAKDLTDKYFRFVNTLIEEGIQNSLRIDKLISLKKTLSDINNLMTLIATRAIARKIANTLKMNNENQSNLFLSIEQQKPNTNGFDIKIPLKNNGGTEDEAILVEVKCNYPVHEGKFGAAQLNAIIEDAMKLQGNSEKHKKAKKEIKKNGKYLKIITIVDFSKEGNSKNIDLIEQVIKRVSPQKNMEGTSPKKSKYDGIHLKRTDCLLDILTPNKGISQQANLDLVYVTMLTTQDLADELDYILKEE